MTHINFSILDRPWSTWWLITYSTPIHFLNQCWLIVNWTTGNKLQWNLNQNITIFIQVNVFQNVVRKMSAILSRAQCAKNSTFYNGPIFYNHTKTKQSKTVITSNECVLLSSIQSAYHPTLALQWRHNGRDDVSNNKPRDYLLNRLFRRRLKKHQRSASLAFVWVIHRWPVNYPHKGPVTRKTFPFDDVIMESDRKSFVYGSRTGDTPNPVYDNCQCLN